MDSWESVLLVDTWKSRRGVFSTGFKHLACAGELSPITYHDVQLALAIINPVSPVGALSQERTPHIPTALALSVRVVYTFTMRNATEAAPTVVPCASSNSTDTVGEGAAVTGACVVEFGGEDGFTVGLVGTLA